jgi:hypothetical protein
MACHVELAGKCAGEAQAAHTAGFCSNIDIFKLPSTVCRNPGHCCYSCLQILPTYTLQPVLLAAGPQALLLNRRYNLSE